MNLDRARAEPKMTTADLFEENKFAITAPLNDMPGEDPRLTKDQILLRRKSGHYNVADGWDVAGTPEEEEKRQKKKLEEEAAARRLAEIYGDAFDDLDELDLNLNDIENADSPNMLALSKEQAQIARKQANDLYTGVEGRTVPGPDGKTVRLDPMGRYMDEKGQRVDPKRVAEANTDNPDLADMEEARHAIRHARRAERILQHREKRVAETQRTNSPTDRMPGGIEAKTRLRGTFGHAAAGAEINAADPALMPPKPGPAPLLTATPGGV